MYLGIRGRLDLIVMHPSFIQELFPESSSTQLDNIKLLTASVKPPQRQCNDREEEEYRLASERLYLAYPGPALFRIMWDPEPPYGFRALRPAQRKSEYGVLANGVSLGAGYGLVNRLAGGVLWFGFLGEPMSRVRPRCRLDRFRKGGGWDIVLW